MKKTVGNVTINTSGAVAVVRLSGSAFAAVLTKHQCRKLAEAMIKAIEELESK